jgi:hypothetical protein
VIVKLCGVKNALNSLKNLARNQNLLAFAKNVNMFGVLIVFRKEEISVWMDIDAIASVI